MTINTPGVKSFTNEGVYMNFLSGTLPFGEICVTLLNIPPDSVPLNKSFTNTASKYWIINNYGTSVFTAVSNMTLLGYGTINAAQASVPRKFKMYRRNTGAYLAGAWTKIDSANAATSSTNAALTYSGNAVSFFNTQFTVSRDSCYAPNTPLVSSSNTSFRQQHPHTFGIRQSQRWRQLEVVYRRLRWNLGRYRQLLGCDTAIRN